MAIVMNMKWAGVTKDQYEQVRKTANWEGDIPKGAKYHAASFDDNGLRVTDLWDSAPDFDAFVGTRLMPAVQQAGITGEPDIDITEAHSIFAPNPG